MRTLLVILVLFAAGLGSQGQVMDNNSAPAKAAIKLKKETGYYKHRADDDYFPDMLCKMWIKEFDRKGRLLKFTDHWQCGKRYCTYEYKYDNIGKCTASWVSYQSNAFKRTKIIHTYDNRGNVIERKPSRPIPSYPIKETYSYNADGLMITFNQWKMKGGKPYIDYVKNGGNTNYDTIKKYKVYEDKKELKWTVTREFEYYVN